MFQILLCLNIELNIKYGVKKTKDDETFWDKVETKRIITPQYFKVVKVMLLVSKHWIDQNQTQPFIFVMNYIVTQSDNYKN